jgi:hypothetical protein
MGLVRIITFIGSSPTELAEFGTAMVWQYCSSLRVVVSAKPIQELQFVDVNDKLKEPLAKSAQDWPQIALTLKRLISQSSRIPANDANVCGTCVVYG